MPIDIFNEDDRKLIIRLNQAKYGTDEYKQIEKEILKKYHLTVK